MIKSTDTNQVFFDLSIPLNRHDLDSLLSFLASDSHSAGGKIISHRLVKGNKSKTRRLIVVYASADSSERVLARKFFTYKSYMLRSSRSGYMSDYYETFANRIVVQSLNEIDREADVYDYISLIVPESAVLEVRASNIFKQIYYVTFKHRVLPSAVSRPNGRMRLLNSYVTKSLVFVAKNGWHTGEFTALKSRIKLEMHFRRMNFMFMDEDVLNGGFLVQFETDFELREFTGKVINEVCVKSALYEYCFNFQLII